MISHLWLSTATAAAAVVIVLSLRNAPARIRFAILLLATIRFAIPTLWLTTAGAALAACLPSRVIAAQAPSLEGLLRPGFVRNIEQPAKEIPLDRIGQALWLIGTIASLVVWLKRNSAVEQVREPDVEEIVALERAAVRMNVAVPPLKIAAAGITPGAAGLWRPEVVLPDDLSASMNADELEAVCAHELAHIRRRDNLCAAISRIIAAVFWFHPLIRWMDRRMRAERELACDEMVVASGSPEVYATALSKVCMASQGAYGSFAGMAGPNLKERLERVMTNKFAPMRRGFCSIPAVLALLAVLIPVGGGFLRAQAPSRPGEALFQSAYDCFNRKDYAKAETLFRRMITEFPADVRGTTGLAEVYQALRRPDEAVRLMRDFAEKNPSSLEIHLAYGNTLLRSETYKDALAEYQKALKLASKPEESKVYFRIGETYRRMGNLREAMAAFRRAKDLGNSEAALQFALILDGTGDTAGAEREYRAILEKANHSVALNNLAYRLAERDRELDTALDYALRAQRAMPESSDITDTVGWIYLKKRMPDQAAPAFATAMLAVAGGAANPLYRQHLAAALDLKGDWTPDRRELRTLLDTASKPEQLARLQKLLRASQ